MVTDSGGRLCPNCTPGICFWPLNSPLSKVYFTASKNKEYDTRTCEIHNVTTQISYRPTIILTVILQGHASKSVKLELRPRLHVYVFAFCAGNGEGIYTATQSRKGAFTSYNVVVFKFPL